ncbi:MAG: carbohydrate ABC transporter permease [Clostridiales bacterium]|jgi:multiple sugar transport system permease protein|nr:carbohydrate ABC transporter permease [Clostridiales bacterium]
MSNPVQKRVSLAVAYGLLLVTCMAALLPFFWLLRSSLMDRKQLFAFPIMIAPDPFRWDNYPKALGSAPFVRYFFNTLFLVAMNMAGTVLSSAMAGYSFTRLRWKGKKLAFYAMLSTMMIPSFITLIPTFLIWSGMGLTDTYWPLILPAWLGGGAYNIFLMRQFFMTIPMDLDNAALIDGAGPPRIFWSILMPLLKPVLATIAIFTFMGVWNDLLGPVIYLNTEKMYTLSLGLSAFRGMYGTRWDYLMAASTVVTMPMIAIFFIFQKYFVEGITLSGIKG